MNLSKLVFVFMNGTRLAGAWKSKTTRKQYMFVLAACVALAAAGTIFPEYANDATAAGVIAGVIPLIRRYVQYKPKPVKVEVPTPRVPSMEDTVLEAPSPAPSDPRLQTTILKVRKKDEINKWHEFHAQPLLKAYVDGWDYAIDLFGEEWDVYHLEKTGRTIRLPHPAPAGAVTAAKDAIKNRLAEIKNKAGE